LTPVLRVDSVVLGSARIEAAVALYRALGLPLVEERHEDGAAHYACEIGGAHFAIYPAAEGEAAPRGTGGFTQIGFQVRSLEDAFAAARAAGAGVLVPPEEVPWGRRAVITDPDGRPVELNQG